MNARELDTELRRWADAHHGTEEQLTELRRRVLANAGEPIPAIRFDRREPSWLGRMAWALAGAALAMLCLHIVRLPRQGTPVQSGVPQDEAVALVRSTTPNGETAEVFQETRRLFPSNLRWVADTDQQFLVDVAETTGSSSSTRSSNGFAHVSLVAVARTPGKSWQVLWRTVVYTQGGEYATVPVPGGQATIWAHPADSSVVAVETQLSLLGVSTTASRLLTAGDCAPLIVQQTAEREFRVYQTAQSVDDLPQT